MSCAYHAGDLDASVLSEGAGAFGDFDSHTVDGGNDRIARALAEGLEAGVRLSSPVSRVAWRDREVRVLAGGQEAVADAAVITVPASVLDSISFDPPLPPAKATVRYGQAAKLFVALRSPAQPSQTLSVDERYWCYTQVGLAGEPLSYVAAFAGSPGALERLEVARWARAVDRVAGGDFGRTLTSTSASTLLSHLGRRSVGRGGPIRRIRRRSRSTPRR